MFFKKDCNGQSISLLLFLQDRQDKRATADDHEFYRFSMDIYM